MFCAEISGSRRSHRNSPLRHFLAGGFEDFAFAFRETLDAVRGNLVEDRIDLAADEFVWRQFEIGRGLVGLPRLGLRAVGGDEFARTVKPTANAESRFEVGEIGVRPDTHPHIRQVRAGEAAERAGLKANDVVVSINGETITFSSDLKAAISKRPEEQITRGILRDGAPMTVLATPARRGTTGFLGIDIADETVSVRPGLLGAAAVAALERRDQRD